MGSNSYVKEAINNFKKRLKEGGLEYNKKLSDVNYSLKKPLLSVDYRAELYTSVECNECQVSFYQNLIGVLRFSIELRIFLSLVTR